jgi:hypothetical protein
MSKTGRNGRTEEGFALDEKQREAEVSTMLGRKIYEAQELGSENSRKGRHARIFIDLNSHPASSLNFRNTRNDTTPTHPPTPPQFHHSA